MSETENVIPLTQKSGLPRKRRPNTSETERQQHLAQWHRSGLSAQRYAVEHGLRGADLYRWQRGNRDRRGACTAGAARAQSPCDGFLTIDVEQPAAGLRVVLRHGALEMEDTNLLESKFRPTKIGQRNFNFIGHPDAGQKSAIMYSILATCRIHRIEPRSYLTDVLEQLIAYDGEPPAQLLQSLLPWNWAQSHPQAIVKEPLPA